MCSILWIQLSTYMLPFPASHVNLIYSPLPSWVCSMTATWSRDDEFFQGMSEKAWRRKLGEFCQAEETHCTGLTRSEQERKGGKSGLFSATGAWNISRHGLIQEAKSLARWKSQPHAQGQEMCDFIYPSFHLLVSRNSHFATWKKANVLQFGMNFLALLKR